MTSAELPICSLDNAARLGQSAPVWRFFDRWAAREQGKAEQENEEARQAADGPYFAGLVAAIKRVYGGQNSTARSRHRAASADQHSDDESPPHHS